MTENSHHRVQRDDELRQRFARLRAEVESHAPPFEELRRPAREPQPRARAVGTLVAVAVAASLLLLVGRDFIARARRTQEAGADVDRMLAAATWEGPTDFLLETRTRALLRAIPTIGDLEFLNTATARAGRPASRRTSSRERNR